jgi:hypothetical protein
MPKVSLETLAENGNRRALVSFATGPHEELLDIALPSFREFADRHGYDLIIGHVGDTARPASWMKIPILKDVLGARYDEALFIGADCVITDPTDDLDVPDGYWQAMVNHRNANGEIPNCDVWYLRHEMRPLLGQIWAMTEYVEHGWWEQAAVLSLMGYAVGTIPNLHQKPTELYDKTYFLDDGWNVHRWCIAPDHPRIMHATMYEDRARMMRQWAKHAIQAPEEIVA